MAQLGQKPHRFNYLDFLRPLKLTAGALEERKRHPGAVAPDELFPNRQQFGFDFGLEVQGNGRGGPLRFSLTSIYPT
jgi:hypothetical protein